MENAKFDPKIAGERLAEGKDFLTANPKYNGKNYVAYLAQVYKTLVQQPGYNHDKALKEAWQLTEIQVLVKKVSPYGTAAGFGAAKLNHPGWSEFQNAFIELCEKHKDSIAKMKTETGRIPAIYPKIVNKDTRDKFDKTRKAE